MKNKKKFLKNGSKTETYEKFKHALESYKPEELEKAVNSPDDIYLYYEYIDELYVWTKNAYKNDLCVLCNEMRAIMGHLSEYDVKDEKSKKNLEKAYGHVRRLSIDTLKILCNAFDEYFSSWITKHARYDYRNIDNEFFPIYVELYNKAHKGYIEAQKSENLGSDRENNIIIKYHAVAKNFEELYAHHISDRRIKIEKITRRFKINNVAWIVCTLFLTILSIVETII